MTFTSIKTSAIRILIVDDEPLARQRIARLIEPLENYEICAEASNGKEALEQIDLQHPDIVLMDVRMPEMDGLAASQQIAQLQHPPAIIFCTAYDDYAISAFKVQASDYLLKPARKEALYEALERAKQVNKLQIQSVQAEPALPNESQSAKTLVAKSSRGSELLDMNNIYYFTADQKYVSVFHTQGETLIDHTLKELEQEFPDKLLRIHRNTLVNKVYIEAIYKSSTGQHQLQLRNVNSRLSVSRRHLPEVKSHIHNAGI
jgi:two-component system response regulator AlgR